MNLNKKITTEAEARQYAIDWQNWAFGDNAPKLYQSELYEWSVIFTELGKRFNLTDEFQENGII